MNRRVVGLVALLAGAPLAVVATFLPLYEQVWRFNLGDTMTLSHTSWLVRTSSGSVFGREALYGVPVVVAAALVVVGAVFGAGLGRAVWGRLVAFGGAMLLLGAAWAVGQLAFATYSAEQPAVEGMTVDTQLGSAVPVYGVACLLAVVGGLLVQDWPARAAVAEGPAVYRVDEAVADDLTPPFGLALPGAGLPPGPDAGGWPPAPDSIVPPGYDSAGGDGGGVMRREGGGER